MAPLHSLIVGPGAIGALTCAHLNGLGACWVHPHRTNLTLATNIQLKSRTVPLTWQLHPPAQPIDLIWVTCKAEHVVPQTQALLKQHPQASAILLHNGLGPQAQLSQEFGDRIIWGSTTCGALASSALAFQQTSFGDTELGLNLTRPRHQLIQQALMAHQHDGPLQLKIADDIERTLWRKILINACINPITAARQIRNGDLRANVFHDDIEHIINETNLILKALGKPCIEKAFETVMAVCEFSAGNYSSMAVDVQQKRRTEIDFINGYLIQQANALAIAVPTLKKWYKEIASLEHS